MLTVKSTRLIVCAGAALALCACASMDGALSSSAERLERSAYDLSEDARDDDHGLGRDFADDAEEFASEARDFRRVVEEGDGDEDDVQDAFRDLSRSYHALRDEIDDSNERSAEVEFKDVTEAYLDIEREVRGTEDDDSFAAD